MAERFQGEVAKITTKTSKPGAKRSWKLYSFQLRLDGTDREVWITFGFDKEPPFVEGDSVSVEAKEDDNGYLVYVEGSGSIVAKPVAAGATTTVQAGVGAPVDNGPAAAVSSTKREVAEGDRQRQIVGQHSQEMAIAIVGLLLQHDGLPMTTAKTKSAQPQRFEEIVAAVDKFTIKFHNDITTGRLALTVADMGVVTVTARDAIPAAEKKAETNTGSEY